MRLSFSFNAASQPATKAIATSALPPSAPLSTGSLHSTLPPIPTTVKLTTPTTVPPRSQYLRDRTAPTAEASLRPSAPPFALTGTSTPQPTYARVARVDLDPTALGAVSRSVQCAQLLPKNLWRATR